MKNLLRRSSTSGRLYAAILSVTILTVILTGIMSFQFAFSSKNEDRDTALLDYASMIAQFPQTRTMILTGECPPDMVEQLDAFTSSVTLLDLIVVCNTDSIRIYHTNHERIGESFIGDDQGRALDGAEPYISVATGSMGLQRRAFHAVTDASGNVIGFVMTSVLQTNMTHVRNQIISAFISILLVMIFASMIIAAIFQEHLKTILLGYKPEVFANLYIERAEVLDALDEGLFAIDTEGRVIIMNRSAKRMLDLPEDASTEGEYLVTYYPETKLPVTVTTGVSEHNINFQIKGKHIISSRIPVRRNGKIIGAVSIFRNKTEVIELAEELVGSKYVIDSLRAVNHEFMNKLHVILGLLEMDETEKAKEYILGTQLISGKAVADIHSRVPIPSLAALIIGKLLRANELGISFVLKQDSYFYPKEHHLPSECWITLVGNLVENAIDELNGHDYPVKQIELGIYSEEGHTTIVCDDTGGGIPEEILFSIYDPHTTTKGEGHGNGFRLMKDIVDRYEGTFHIETEEGEGTSIEILLPV